LRRWADRRLPRWARPRANATDDAPPDPFETLTHFDTHEPRRQALQRYLRETIAHRIADGRRAAESPASTLPMGSVDPTLPDSVFDQAVSDEDRDRYRAALERLGASDRDLIVARLELGYTYEQIALATGRESLDSARVAIQRALLRLAVEMSSG
jgi:DNA-directed RNA polymerase specialized sigma24 family protein